VRINVPEILERQLECAPRGTVYVSSVCDAWQPVEQTYSITRRCLQLLVESGFPLFLQTKSALIGRDLDILEGRHNVTLGVTLTSMSERQAGVFEPGASSPSERLRVLRLARECGLRTFVFLGPLLPGLSDRGEGLVRLFQHVAAASPDFLFVDRLNRRAGMWKDTRAAVEACAPDLVAEYRRVLFNTDPSYEVELRSRVQQVADSCGLGGRIEWCF